MERFCVVCGKTLNKTQKKYCSLKCHGKMMSEQLLGKNNPMFGVDRSGKKAPFWGRHHTKETRDYLSEIRIAKGLSKGEKNPNFGNHFKQPEEAKIKISSGNKGKHRTKEQRLNYSNALLGLPKSEEHKKNMRISAIKRIKRQKRLNNMSPSFNEEACKYFEKFDIDHNTNGLYGKNEYLIEDLGYWPDYINFDLKLIMEWDEKAHYTLKGTLREKDVIRQQQIQNKFKDFTFVRIKEEEDARA